MRNGLNESFSLSGLKDRKPMELMENMLAFHRLGDASFLWQLPPPLCTTLASSPATIRSIMGVNGGGRSDFSGFPAVFCAQCSSGAASVPSGRSCHGCKGSSGRSAVTVSRRDKRELCFNHHSFGPLAEHCIRHIRLAQ